MLPFTIDLTGKVAVVTGGGGVLCAEMCKALAACGAKVVVLSRKLANAEKVAQEIEADGGVALPLSCDVTDLDSIRAANAATEAAFGVCDILINGAGGNAPAATASVEKLTQAALADDAQRTFYDLDPAGIDFTFDVNFLGTVRATQVFSRKMAERETGCIINISSMSASRPLTRVGSYSASKAAVDNFTAWLATHLAEVGVRVNAIAPGFFLTRQNERILTEEDGSLTKRGNKIIGQTPMGRFGDASELIGALLWLVSDAGAGFVTGIVVPVDGGFSAYSL